MMPTASFASGSGKYREIHEPLDLEFDINAARENAATTFDYRE